ncbi:MAG: hypothetical protein CMJ32_08835 [Phycisphaerae bacterium]|nr:hypothetical protein [Phycisphaerae bacterium]
MAKDSCKTWSWLMAFFLGAIALQVTAVPPAEDSMNRDRLESLLAADDPINEAIIIEIFRRNPDQVLMFIDSYLEGGLEIIETNGSMDKAGASFRKGIQFANLADKAFRQNDLTRYAAGFASWSPTEQKRFRKGQALYRQGRTAESEDKLEQAAELYERSLELADSLNDSWGMQMALSGLARVALEQARYKRAQELAIRAIDLSSRLHLRHAQIKSMMIAAKAREQLELPDRGVGHLRQAWKMLTPDDDIDFRQQVYETYLSAAIAADRDQEVMQLRMEAPIKPTSTEQDDSGS